MDLVAAAAAASEWMMIAMRMWRGWEGRRASRRRRRGCLTHFLRSRGRLEQRKKACFVLRVKEKECLLTSSWTCSLLLRFTLLLSPRRRRRRRHDLHREAVVAAAAAAAGVHGGGAAGAAVAAAAGAAQHGDVVGLVADEGAVGTGRPVAGHDLQRDRQAKFTNQFQILLTWSP